MSTPNDYATNPDIVESYFKAYENSVNSYKSKATIEHDFLNYKKAVEEYNEIFSDNPIKIINLHE